MKRIKRTKSPFSSVCLRSNSSCALSADDEKHIQGNFCWGEYDCIWSLCEWWSFWLYSLLLVTDFLMKQGTLRLPACFNVQSPLLFSLNTRLYDPGSSQCVLELDTTNLTWKILTIGLSFFPPHFFITHQPRCLLKNFKWSFFTLEKNLKCTSFCIKCEEFSISLFLCFCVFF